MGVPVEDSVPEEEGNNIARWECLRKRETIWCDSGRPNVRYGVLALDFGRLYPTPAVPEEERKKMARIVEDASTSLTL